jgi:uncharacterized protein YbbC (DUF1343 family)
MPVARSGLWLMLSAFLACLMLFCGAPAPVSASPAAAGVRPGIEVFLDDVPAALRGKRVGLITNNTGVDRSGTSDIDLIAQHDELTLVALLAPEHGIRGTLEAGVTVADGLDAKTGLPVYSLYAAQGHSPTPEMLKDVDVLVYDLQEVGGRTWTYVSTMALSMQAAARKGIPFVVLDRPNPIGGDIVEGALLDPAFSSFIGMYPIPARHGMTVGELATLFNRQAPPLHPATVPQSARRAGRCRGPRRGWCPRSRRCRGSSSGPPAIGDSVRGSPRADPFGRTTARGAIPARERRSGPHRYPAAG